MTRRKTRPPSTDAEPAAEPAPDAPAAAVAAPAVEANAQAALEPAAPTAPDTAPVPPPAPLPTIPASCPREHVVLDAVIDHGDLREERSRWLSLYDELVAWYGAEGPVELALVERITDLRWRLYRFARAERGMVATATIGLTWQRATYRLNKAIDDDPFDFEVAKPVLAETSPLKVARASRSLAAMVQAYRAGEEVDSKDLSKLLHQIFGTDDDKQPMGQGRDVANAWSLWRMGIEDEAAMQAGKPSQYDEGERPGEHRAALEASFIAQLDEVVDMLDGIEETLSEDEDARDLAAVEARGIPAADSLRGLAVYEQHLQRSITETAAELQRTIARRRLAAMARRARLV